MAIVDPIPEGLAENNLTSGTSGFLQATDTNYNQYVYKDVAGTGIGSGGLSLYPQEEEDDLEVVEEVQIDKEYDEGGNVTRETRTVRRPKDRALRPRTPPLQPRDRPIPWQDPQPWVTPNRQPYWQPGGPNVSPGWQPNTSPGWHPNDHTIWCGPGMNTATVAGSCPGFGGQPVTTDRPPSGYNNGVPYWL